MAARPRPGGRSAVIMPIKNDELPPDSIVKE